MKHNNIINNNNNNIINNNNHNIQSVHSVPATLGT